MTPTSASPRFCPNCGTATKEGAAFCGGCGQPFAQPHATAGAAPQAAATTPSGQKSGSKTTALALLVACFVVGAGATFKMNSDYGSAKRTEFAREIEDAERTLSRGQVEAYEKDAAEQKIRVARRNLEDLNAGKWTVVDPLVGSLLFTAIASAVVFPIYFVVLRRTRR